MKTRGNRHLRSPIFLNCLSRGGSNIFWNLFLTHPDVCSPIRETIEIFRADWRSPTRAGLWLAFTSGQPRLFDQWYLLPRRRLSPSRQRFIDRTLYENKMRTVSDREMRFKSRNEVYTREEVERARLVAKNNNGLVFLNERFRDIYPDSVFFCLVRHPVPLYESHKRRRLWRTPKEFAGFYNTVTGKMADEADRCDRTFLFRFEDVLEDPVAALRRLYEAADLDIARVGQLRLRSKEHFQQNGSRGSSWEIGHHHWLDFDQVHEFIDPNIDRLHRERLEPDERSEVVKRTAPVRERLGYGG